MYLDDTLQYNNTIKKETGFNFSRGFSSLFYGAKDERSEELWLFDRRTRLVRFVQRVCECWVQRCLRRGVCGGTDGGGVVKERF